MKIHNLKRVDKGAVKYQFDIEFDNFGLTIKSCTWMEKDNRGWIGWPNRPYEEAGERKYFSYVYWTKERLDELTRHVKHILPTLPCQEPIRGEPRDGFKQNAHQAIRKDLDDGEIPF